MRVWVWHCPKCGNPDGVYLSETDAEDYDDSDGCDQCGYSGGHQLYELSEEEAIECGWLSAAKYVTPEVLGHLPSFDDETLERTEGLASLARYGGAR
ncbi:MAG: hypothetical protein HOQ32_01085 [Lysobacter sp.]|nr:hypothetical protein [Lysobacter sp.]